MAISQKTKTVVEETTYICDMLFKEVTKQEIYKVYHNHCISKEAVNRLPADVANNPTILKYVLYGSGQKEDGFQPEWLHHGVWVLEVPGNEYGFVAKLANNSEVGDSHYKNTQFRKDDDPACFKTCDDVMAWISSRCKCFKDTDFRYWVFVDGKLVKTIEIQAIPVEVQPNENDED